MDSVIGSEEPDTRIQRMVGKPVWGQGVSQKTLTPVQGKLVKAWSRMDLVEPECI